MASQNVETFRAAHQAFNRRDFDWVLSKMSEGLVFRIELVVSPSQDATASKSSCRAG